MWLFLLTCYALFASIPIISVRHSSMEVLAFQGSVKKLPDIYWNTSNPIFRIDNTHNIIDVNKGKSSRSYQDYDQVNIICPLYNKPVQLQENDLQQKSQDEDVEKFVIYHVNKEEFDTCRIMSQHPKIIAKCDTPYEFKYITISFRYFSPLPGALEFQPGKDYYFISTSSKADLHMRLHGMCLSHNMRVVFKVAPIEPATKAPLPPPAPTLSPFSHITEQSPVLTDGKGGEGPAAGTKDRKRKKNRKNRRKHKRRRKENAHGHSREDNQLIQSDRVAEDEPQNAPPMILDHTPSYVAKVNDLMSKQQASIGASSHSSSATGGLHSSVVAVIFICLILCCQ